MKSLINLSLFFFSFHFLNAQCNRLCNADFEENIVTILGGNTAVNEANVSCWETTASDHMIEVWSSGFQGVNALSGQQFIELNANQVSTLYQDFNAIEGELLTIQFGHRGRMGNDVISLEIGPIGGPFQEIGVYTSGNSQWSVYTATYIVPIGQGSDYSLRFNSVSSAGGNQSVGNFLDNIQISTSGQMSIDAEVQNKNCLNNGGEINILLTGQVGATTVTWQPNIGNDLTVSDLQAGIYTVIIEDEIGCIVIDSFEIEEFVPIIFVDSASICDYETFNFHGDILSSTGVYSHHVLDQLGCDSVIYTLHLNIKNSPSLNFSISPDIINDENSQITITNLSASGINYEWQIGNEIFENNDSSFLIVCNDQFLETGSIILIGSSNGCSDTLIKFITIDLDHSIQVPNVFSPNEDDKNDVFSITSNNIKNFEIVILNRWGNKIFTYEGDVDGLKWNGISLDGKKVNNGLYFYRIKYSSNNKFYIKHGVITLL